MPNSRATYHYDHVIETIALIQRESFIAVGIMPSELQATFQLRRDAAQRFQEQNPGYLEAQQYANTHRPQLFGIETNLAKRFDIETPTPYEDPWLYSWLSELWAQHKATLYSDDHELGIEFVLATAPTGRFNALAIPGQKQNGLLIEDGLLYFSRHVADCVSLILYERAPKGYRPRDIAELPSQLIRWSDELDALAQTCISYISDGYCDIKPIVSLDPEEDFAIRHLLLFGAVSFIFEHEIHHLKISKDRASRRAFGERQFAAVWEYIQRSMREQPEVIPDKDSLFERFLMHLEEITADINGLSSTVVIGKLDDTKFPTIDGALLFFYMAELIQNTILRIQDVELLEGKRGLSGEKLSILALLSGETHPYPLARRHSAISTLSRLAPQTGKILAKEAECLDLVFDAIWTRIDQHIKNADAAQEPIKVHDKWNFELPSVCALVTI